MNKPIVIATVVILSGITACSDSNPTPQLVPETAVNLEGAIGLSTRVVIDSGYETDLDICETPRGCIYPNITMDDSEMNGDAVPSEDRDAPPSHAVWFDIPCPVCGRTKTNFWEKRISRALNYQETVCEACIAKEYDVSIDGLRAAMEDHFGLTPCLGL